MKDFPPQKEQREVGISQLKTKHQHVLYDELDYQDGSSST